MARLPLATVLLCTLAMTAGAQCPDGSPPPCRMRPVAPAVVPIRRADPPLDGATWIVLPFDNLSKSPDVEWLRDASVNLLYLDLSKWHDIKVVDDERVADFLREVPEARGGKQLSLSAGLAVARRAGAGKLVMGDLLKVGSRTTMTAKVFDVRGGQRIRTAHEEATAQDSLMPAFGKLARGILNVAPPEGANVGAIGTTSTVAYQDYLEGVKALNRFDLKTARTHFETALKQDSSFALAHYKLAVLIGWQSAADPSKLDHARAAARFSAALPARERGLITGQLAFENQEYARACTAYGALIRADSTDVDALYGMGECLWHDTVVEPIGGDTTRLRYRGSWNSAIRVFKRALEVDPSFHLAFQHILDSYVAENRPGCRLKDPTALSVQNPVSSCVETYSTAVRRQGDSLVMQPVPVRDAATLLAHADEARRTNARRQNIEKAREIANAWVAAGPTETRARVTLARIDLLLGEVYSADTLLSKVRVADLTDSEQGTTYVAGVEIAWKLGRTAELSRTVDSIAATYHTGQAGQFAALALAALGRLGQLDSLIVFQLRRATVPPAVMDYYRMAPQVVLGATPDTAVSVESALFGLMRHSGTAAAGVRLATTQIAPTLMFGLRLPRTAWPAIDSVVDRRLMPAYALARNDTAALRAAAKSLDSVATVVDTSNAPDNGSAAVAADAYLLVGDSAKALTTLRRFLDHGINATPMFTSLGNGFSFTSFLWPRMLLLRGDLEAAIGNKDAARNAYRRFLALWLRADPGFQPMIDRARKGLAALGSG